MNQAMKPGQTGPVNKSPRPVELAPLSGPAPKAGPVAQPPLTKAAARTPEGDELDLLIRARYPVVYVVSWEEARVEQHLAQIAAARKKELFTWSVTRGLRKSGINGTSGGSSSVMDPVEALDTVIEHKEPAIYLFFDLHNFLHTRCMGNRGAIRKTREVARALSDSYKTLVICAPSLDMAPDLEKDVTVLDYPLPGPEELSRLLDKISEDVADHPGLTVDLNPKSREAIVQAAGGLTVQEAENVLAKTLVNDGKLTGDDVSTVFAEKQQIVRKSGLLEYYPATSNLEDIGGLENLKDWLRKRANAFTDEARDYGLPCPKGVLLVGVQGCGKSLCAKAVSKAWNMPLLRFDVGRMFSSFVGSSESNIRKAIAVAESIAPAVLWIDEIDKAFAGSASSGGTDGGTTARVMSTFLTWLSEKTKPVFVLATANDISQLPPELLRKGRLDEIFFVDLPTDADRRRIVEIHLAKRKRVAAEFDIGLLSAAMEGFSGAEIEQAVISAMYDSFDGGRPLATADLLASIRETVPLSKTMSERIDALRAWADGRARAAGTAEAVEPAAAGSQRRKLEV